MYASQEASIMAACRADGRLHTIPLNNYYEVLSPGTEQPAVAVDGTREGELVVTHLYQGAKPLVRYRTGDMVRLTAERGSGREVLQPIGRVRDALRLGGRQVTAFDLEQVLFMHLRGVLDYFLFIDEVDGQDVVTIRVDPADEEAARRIDRVAIRQAVTAAFGAGCEVTVGPVGSITSTGAMVSWKAARLHDRRSAEAEPERLAALAIAAGRDSR
jgi:phenylacetate-CoA ligase